MKKLIISTVLFSSCYFLFAQPTSQNDDLANLKNQVSNLQCKVSKTEKKLNTFMKVSKLMQDSIMVQLNSNEQKFKMVSDSLLSSQEKISILKSEVDKNKSNLKQWMIVDVILFILILIIIISYYLFMSKKIIDGDKKLEVKLTTMNETLEAELKNTRKELDNLKEK